MEVWRGLCEGLNAVIVNPSIILGAANWHKGSAAIFKNIYEEFPWYSDGVTGVVYAEDVARAMMLLMDSNISGERFILNNENISYKNLFSLIAQSFHKKAPRKKVTPFLAALVWRLEAMKYFFTGKKPLITKETASTAQAKVYFDNSKLLKYFPSFSYTPLPIAIEQICSEFKSLYNLD